MNFSELVPFEPPPSIRPPKDASSRLYVYIYMALYSCRASVEWKNAKSVHNSGLKGGEGEKGENGF